MACCLSSKENIEFCVDEGRWKKWKLMCPIGYNRKWRVVCQVKKKYTSLA